jgi:hypothetical protein
MKQEQRKGIRNTPALQIRLTPGIELREAAENYHAVENPIQNRNRSTSISGAVIRKVVIEDKDIKI